MEDWNRKRTWMFVNFCVTAFLFGLSLTAYYATEYYYFKDFMKAKFPSVLYGLSWAFLCGSGVVSSLIGSYYADFTKDVRRISIVTCLLNVLGNILYVLYYSPYVVLVGQILVGTSSARMVTAVGEITRVYKTKEITAKLSFLGIFSAAGTVIGPCTTYVYQLVDIDFGGWILNIGNMPGVFMGFLYLMQFFLTYFTLENVSQKFTLKKSTSTENLIDENSDEIKDNHGNNGSIEAPPPNKNKDQGKSSFKEEYVKALSTLIQDGHVMFLFSLCFFVTYGSGTLTLLAPIKVSEYLHWVQTDIATFIIFSTFVGGIPTAILLTFLSKYVGDFFLCLFFVLTLIAALGLMGILPFILQYKTALQVLVYILGVLALSSNIGFQILSRSMLAKYVPENIQTVTEALRNMLFECAYMTAGLLITIPTHYLPHSMFTMAGVICIHMIWYLIKHKNYRHIDNVTDERLQEETVSNGTNNND